MLIVLLVLLLAAAGAGGAYAYLQSQEDDELSDAELEYAEAIADSNDADEENILTHEENLCLGTAYVTALGLEAFEGRVTPQEIRDNPDNDHVDWGIEISQEQGEAIYADTGACIDIPRWMAEGILQDSEDNSEENVACLASSYGDHPVREAMIASLIVGEDAPIDRPHAAAIVAWMSGCLDLREQFFQGFNEDGDVPEDVLACVDENLTDEMIEEFVVDSIASPEDAEPEDFESGQVVFGVVEDCAEDAGQA